MPEFAHPRLVALVREAKGLTQEQLGAAVGDLPGVGGGLSQGFISKVESGLLPLTGDNLAHVAAVLDCPVALLTDDTPVQGLEVTCLHHRRRHTRLSAAAKRRIEAVTHLTRVSVEGLLAGIELVPEVAIRRFDVDEYGDPVQVARTVRAAWKIPSGPVEHVLRVLESVGVVVVVRPLQTRAQDAVSTWPHHTGQPPIMVVNDTLSPDRQRFTVSHELGHLLMHTVPGEDQEGEADRFASEFLMPADQIRLELAGLTTRDLPRLLLLKARWKTSVAALIRRAHDLDVISDRQYREFHIKLRRLGWDESEPNTLTLETPATVQRVQQVHLSDHGYTVEELAAAARMTVKSFRRYYRPPIPGATSPTRLRLVP